MFIRCKNNTSKSLSRGVIADLPLLRTLLAIHQNSQESSCWEVMDSCFSNICTFGSLKNPFAVITSLPELYFRFRRVFLLVQMKKVISMNYCSSTSSWKLWRWVRLELILLIRDIYINSDLNPLTKFTSTEEGLSWKISSHGTSLKCSKRLSQSARE